MHSISSNPSFRAYLPGTWKASTVMLAFILLTVLYLCGTVVYRLFISPLAKIPGPKLAGATHLYEFYYAFILADFPLKLRELHQQYGPIVRISPSELHIVDHEFNLRYFNDKKLDKGEWYYQLASKATAGLHRSTEHKHRRAILGPLFNGEKLQQFNSVIDTHISSFNARLRITSESKQLLNASHLLWALVNDIMVHYILGANPNDVMAPDLSILAKSRSFNALRIASFFRQWPMPVLFKFRYLPIIRNMSPLISVERLVHDLTKSMMFDCENLDKRDSCIASELYSKHEAYQKPWRLRFECSEFMIAGGEALTYNLTHILHGLLTEPACMARLREELDTLDSGETQIWEHPELTKLLYLNAVIREGLRLNDSDAIRFPRQSSETVQYRDYIIPSRTTLSMTEKFMNWNASIHPTPEKFNPDRWLGPDAAMAKQHFIGFGVGSRTCLARDFTLRVMTKTIATLIYGYDIDFADEDERNGWERGYLKLFPPSDVKGLTIIVKSRVRDGFYESNGAADKLEVFPHEL